MPDVAAMIARAAPRWLVAGGGAAAIAAVARVAVSCVFRWALGRVAAAALDGERRARRILGLAGCWSSCCSRRSSSASRSSPRNRVFADAGHRDLRAPGAAGRAARCAASTTLPPSPPMDRDSGARAGADVFLIFIESYGAVTYDRPDVRRALAAARAPSSMRRFTTPAATWSRRSSSRRPSAARRGSRTSACCRASRSAIRIPTRVLMTRAARHAGDQVRARGYRTVALMPGLWQALARGRVLRLRRHLRRGAARLPRPGVRLVRHSRSVHARHGSTRSKRDRRPAAAVRVLPDDQHALPVQPDAAVSAGLVAHASTRIPTTVRRDRRAYDAAAGLDALRSRLRAARSPTTIATLAGYLRRHGGSRLRDDSARRPPAGGGGQRRGRAVGRAGARDRRAAAQILDALKRHGFRDGLNPTRPSLGQMHTLLPMLLDAFSR